MTTPDSGSPCWAIMPVVNPEVSAKHLPAWAERGYRLVVVQDRVRFPVPAASLTLTPWAEYAGYAFSVNWATRWLARKGLLEPDAVVVYAGEDMRPDPARNASEVADYYRSVYPQLDGVVQPIGDDLPGTDRICGSPIIGRKAIDTLYGGMGPFFPGYNHYYADEELFEVTKRAGLLVQARDLTHYHDHWTRNGGRDRPEHHGRLQQLWEHDKRLHETRAKRGYPGALSNA